MTSWRGGLQRWYGIYNFLCASRIRQTEVSSAHLPSFRFARHRFPKRVVLLCNQITTTSAYFHPLLATVKIGNPTLVILIKGLKGKAVLSVHLPWSSLSIPYCRPLLVKDVRGNCGDKQSDLMMACVSAASDVICAQVTIIGKVIAYHEGPTRVLLEVHDGTGAMEVCSWVDDVDSQVGWGAISRQGGGRGFGVKGTP